jgi:hypothetical protein
MPNIHHHLLLQLSNLTYPSPEYVQRSFVQERTRQTGASNFIERQKLSFDIVGSETCQIKGERGDECSIVV